MQDTCSRSEKLRNLMRTGDRHSFDFFSHLSYDCIYAFVAFLYSKDARKACSTIKLALEVLGIALEFAIFDLASEILHFFKQQRKFQVEDALTFFIILKSFDHEETNQSISTSEEVETDNVPSEAEGQDVMRSNEMDNEVAAPLPVIIRAATGSNILQLLQKESNTILNW